MSNTNVPVEEVFIEDWVIISQGFGQSRQSSGRDLLQRRLVCFVPDPATVNYYAIVCFHYQFLEFRKEIKVLMDSNKKELGP